MNKCLLIPDREPTTDLSKNTGKANLVNQLNLIGITYRNMDELLLSREKMYSKTAA